jgi:hypothetical protein
MGALHRPTGPKPMDLKSILSSPLGEVFPNNNRNNTNIDNRGAQQPLNNFPFKPSPRDETRFTKSGGERRRQQRKENDEEEEEAQQVPPPMFSTVKKKKRRDESVFRVFEAPPPKYAEEDEDDEEEEVIVLTARKKKKTKRKTTSSRFAIFDGGKGGFDDDEGKKKGDGRAAADAPTTATKKKKKKRKFDEEDEGGEMKKEETIRRAVPATTLPFPTSATPGTTTTKKNEKIKEDDDGNKTAKRRRRCSSGAAATTDTNNNNTNNKNSNAEFEKKIELALEREKASGSGRDVMASKSGAIANSPPTAAAAALVPPPVMAGAAMVFDASKTATTDDVARMKKKPATKSYKNFASKKPPSNNSSKGFPAFDVAAAVAKKKAQIEAAKVQVGFGSSARKPAGIDPIPTKKPVVSSSGSFRLGVSSSSASKRAKSTISSGVGSPFEVQQQQPVSEFQKMIQKARENLESSKAAEMLRSPAPISTGAVAPSPAAVERSTQRSLKMSTPSSSFARAPSAGKHQRFTSPPSAAAAAAAAAAAPKAKVAASSVEQQQRKQPRQQAMPPPAASVKFPVNQTLVFAATNSGNGTGVVDIVAKAKEKTYDPSTAEKAKKKAKEMYDKKLLDAERKEKLGQLSALDATLSSKAPSGVRDLVPRSFASTHDENKKKTASSTSSRVFGGAMTKAQKAHMAMEWEPL